jgi:prophage regulatory protein
MSSKVTRAIASTEPAAAKLIRKPQVLARVPWSDTTLWRRVKDGTFPKPVRISPNCVAWREADVEAWIAGR